MSPRRIGPGTSSLHGSRPCLPPLAFLPLCRAPKLVFLVAHPRFIFDATALAREEAEAGNATRFFTVVSGRPSSFKVPEGAPRFTSAECPDSIVVAEARVTLESEGGRQAIVSLESRDGSGDRRWGVGPVMGERA